MHFSASVGKRLGYYVYAYVDPRNEEVFYIGKGTGNRAFAHLKEPSSSLKKKRITAIHKLQSTPRIDILAHALTEETAFQVERTCIDLLGRNKLTNRVGGIGTSITGRMTVDQINAMYAPKPAKFTHPAILIRINQLFNYGMSAQELYDATRSVWKISPEKARNRLVMSVFDRVIQEVYEVAAWLPAGSTFTGRSDLNKYGLRGRYEFVGCVANDKIRKRYRLKSIPKELLPDGSQNPIRYVD